MRIRALRLLSCFVFLLVGQILWSPGLVRAQTPSTVDPYEVLYGQKIPGWRAAPAGALEPSLGATQVLRAQTEQLLLRAQRAVALHTPGQDQYADKLAADSVRLRQEAERLLREDKPLAAFGEAQQAGAIALFLESFVRIKLLLTQIRGSSSELRRAQIEAVVSGDTEFVMQTERVELDALRARLAAVDVSSVGSLLAKLYAEGTWADASVLQELGTSRQHELSRLLEPLMAGVPADDRPFLERFMIRVLLPALVALEREELNIRWQAHLASPLRGSSAVRVGTEAMQKLARSYAAAANANFALAASFRSTVRLPDDDEWSTFVPGNSSLQISRRQERLGESGPGAPSPEHALALATQTYADSLFTLARIEVAGLPLAASAPVDESARQRRTATYLHKLDQRVRVVAERVRSGLGAIPEPVVLAWTEAQPLLDGNAEEQRTALGSLLIASVYADLTLALAGNPPPPESEEPATPPTVLGGSPTPPREEVLECIKTLQENLELQKQALGFALNRFRRMIPEDETQDLLRKAIVKTCMRAKDLSRDPSPLFWKIYKQELINWTRAVLIQQRAAPALISLCETQTSPLDDLASEPECEQLTQAMSQLDEDDRTLLTIWAEDGELGYPKLGARLGLKPDTARMRVKRAIERLREILLAGRRQRISAYIPGAAGWWPDHLAHSQFPVLTPFPSETSAMAFF